jgi:hypothetical protein
MPPFPTVRDATLCALAVWPRGGMVQRLAPRRDVQRRDGAQAVAIDTPGRASTVVEPIKPAGGLPAVPQAAQAGLAAARPASPNEAFEHTPRQAPVHPLPPQRGDAQLGR